jgi:hypothetical protein
LGTSFFTIICVATLEEEDADADAISLSTPVTVLEPDAAASLVMREV